MSERSSQAVDADRSLFGYALGVAALTIAALMLMHPTVESHSLKEFQSGMSRIASRMAAVHGIVIISEWLAVVGLMGLCDVIGSKQLAVRAGFVAFVVGIGLISANALINGFLFPGLLESGGDQNALTAEDLGLVIGLWKQSNSVLPRACVIACSIGVFCWSIVMLRRRTGTYVPAVIGIFCGALPIVALLVGRFPAGPHGFGLFVAGQCLWYGVVAVQLVRGRI